MFAQPSNPVRWIDDHAALAEVAEDLSICDAIGLDVETRLDFETLCLVQLASRTATYVIDVLAVRNLDHLADLLECESPLKIVHGASFEKRVLAEHDIRLRGVADTLVGSKLARGSKAVGGHSLAAVCQRELGVMLDKRQQTSDWSRRPLSPEQLAYAALDAEVLLPLHDRLHRS